ncbi:MAG TPA: hypothetical protein VE954_40805 [Oligoflexus sp.]|uniref:hypothetical protein n=1 Tax=Oligoflexus sp. TaxID=1971216 RepID=UPI002D578C62|nr:hypothetical protein [Oligoflexus sp.]HYX39482.1 hypothetical protein [Oligoflexus sp.]
MPMKSALYSVALVILALGCHGSKKAKSKANEMVQENPISLIGDHKVPTEATIPVDSVNFFAFATTNADLWMTQSEIIKALKVEFASGHRYKTLVPGTYKTTLKKGEYLVVGWYQYYQFQRNPGKDTFLEFMIKLDDGVAMESTVSTVFVPAEQSEFMAQPNPRLMPHDGVMGQRIDMEKFKYTVEGNEVTLEFPNYIDGRKFQ